MRTAVGYGVLAILIAMVLFAIGAFDRGCGERGLLDPPSTHIYNDP